MNGLEALDYLRRVVRDMAEQGELPKCVAEVPIVYETPVSALGADSLAKATIIAALVDHADLPVSEDVLLSDATVGDLIRIAGIV